MNKTETLLSTALADLMKVSPDQLSVTMTFDEIGVDSLVGLRFIKKIRNVTGIQIEQQEIFDHPSMRALAQLLDARSMELTPTVSN